MKKKTIEEVREFIEEQGYKLLSDKYVNAGIKLEFRCPEKHKFMMVWSRFQQGTRCPICTKIKQRKKTFKETKKFVEGQGYKLLSKEYKNDKKKLRFKCLKGHEFEMRYDSFKNGHRCSFCAYKQKTVKEIRELIENQGYIWISGEYQNANSRLKLECTKGHLYETTWNNFYNHKCRCPICAGTRRKLHEEVQKFIEKQGYKWISGEYKNASSRLKLECPEGHLFKTTWNSFYNKVTCPICVYINSLGPNSPAWRGGISKDPYCEMFSIKEFKEMIKARDNYKCMNPCCSMRSWRLSIHHINYNKLDCDKKNLISICNSCHGATNFNREWHTAWYQAIMYRQYGYIYLNNIKRS